MEAKYQMKQHSLTLMIFTLFSSGDTLPTYLYKTKALK